MSNNRTGGWAALFLVGATAGAVTALLMAPGSGTRTRRKLTRKGEEVTRHLIDTGKELIKKCEDLYERSGEFAEDATHELSAKYRALRDQSEQLLGEAEAILRRARGVTVGR
jgi:gas vesicle protein